MSKFFTDMRTFHPEHVEATASVRRIAAERSPSAVACSAGIMNVGSNSRGQCARAGGRSAHTNAPSGYEATSVFVAYSVSSGSTDWRSPAAPRALRTVLRGANRRVSPETSTTRRLVRATRAPVTDRKAPKVLARSSFRTFVTRRHRCAQCRSLTFAPAPPRRGRQEFCRRC